MINYLATKDLAKLDSKDITYWNEFGQELYGLLSICLAMVGGLYICWYRAFVHWDYQCSCLVISIFLLFEIASAGLGVAYFKLSPVTINIILTSFIGCPLILITYAAFYGIWVSNDYSCYEQSFVQSKDFNPKQIQAYNALSTTDKLRQGAWKPRTRKDCKLFSMLLFNVLAIIGYTVSTAILFKPVYCAWTLGAWIAILELSILLVIKYRESNFDLTPPIVSIASFTGVILLFWTIYIFVVLLLKDEEPYFLKVTTIVTIVGYLLVMIVAFLFIQYQAIGANLRNLSKSFYGMLTITFLVFVGIGAGIYFKTSYQLFGILWIAICFYVLLNLLLFRFKLYLDIIYTLGFVGYGGYLLYMSESAVELFSGVSVLYFGIFLLSFGSFVREYAKNREKRRTSIFMHSQNVFPILEYSLSK